MSDKLSTEARRFLAEELRQTEAALRGVEQSMAELGAKREALMRKAELLRKEAGADLIETAPEPPEGTTHNAEPSNGMSFRAYIREALQEAPRGLKPAEVVEAVRARGWRYDAVQDPAGRTQAELYRMAKLGQVTKRGHLYYPRKGA